MSTRAVSARVRALKAAQARHIADGHDVSLEALLREAETIERWLEGRTADELFRPASTPAPRRTTGQDQTWPIGGHLTSGYVDNDTTEVLTPDPTITDTRIDSSHV